MASSQSLGVQPPSRGKYILAWVAPFVFLIGAWFMPWMYEQSHTKKAPGSEQSYEEAGEAEPAASLSGMSTKEVFQRMASIWPIIVLRCFGDALSGPTVNYIGVNFFAQKYTDLPPKQIHCELNPNQIHCSKGVMDFTQVGMYLGLVVPIMQILLGPALGSLSDSYGRRRVLVAVFTLQFVPAIFIALHVYGGMNLWISFYLTPLRDLPSEAVAMAFIIDMMGDPKSLALAFGIQGAVGTLCGLIASMASSRLTLVSTFTAGFICITASLAYLILFLPESLSPEKRRPLQLRSLLPGLGLGILMRNPLLARLTFFAIFTAFVENGFNSMIGNWLQLYLKWNLQATFMSNVYGALSSILWMGLLMGLLTRSFGEVKVLAFSRVASITGAITFVYSRQVWHIFMIQVFLKGPMSMCMPLISAIKGQVLPASEQGQLQSALNTATSIAGSLGPLCSGIIFRATNNIYGIRTKESNTILWYLLALTVPVLLVLLTIPQLMRVHVPRRPRGGPHSEKAAKLTQ